MASYDDRTALIVVDVQNDFAAPTGSLHVPGAEAAIPAINREIGRAAAAGAVIVYTQDWHPARTPHFQRDGGVWPVHCVGGSEGAAFHPALDVREGPVIRKGTEGEDGYSAFSVRNPDSGEQFATALEAELRERGIERIVIVGLATDYCVKETGLDAARLGFPATVVMDAIRAVDLEPGDGERALDALREAGIALE
ncbi:MAG TPA: isochorismatase family protein [Dehalococcoidia bacterium]|nr:isochorismatase family protein [Dehalococcoidia bacterium]